MLTIHLLADIPVQLANCNSLTFSNRQQLLCDINEHASYVRSQFVNHFQKLLYESLARHVEAILQDGRYNAWASIRSVLYSETEDALSKLLSTVKVASNVDYKTIATTQQDFRGYARKAVENIVRNKTEEQILRLMKHR